MNLNNFSKYNIDNRGNLLSIELEKFKLFKVKRFFLINFKNQNIRGNHAHKKCKQFFICIEGKVKVILKNNLGTKTVTLNSNYKKGLYVKPKTWNTLKPITKKCKILCLCDRTYSKSDYIFDMTEFKKKYYL